LESGKYDNKAPDEVKIFKNYSNLFIFSGATDLIKNKYKYLNKFPLPLTYQTKPTRTGERD
jgi:hypothetical protein